MSKRSDTLILDLETSDLAGNRGHILCAAAKWWKSDKVMSWRLDDVPGYGTTPKSWRNDGPIVRELVKLATSAKAVVAYYGGYGKFDIPFLNTRAVGAGITPLPQLSIVDPYTTARGKLRLARNGLDSVSTLLKCKHKKYHLPWEDWHNAKFGDSAAMSKLVKYCKNDVICLEEVYEKLLPLMNSHPYAADPSTVNPDHRHRQCPACGSTRTMSKGKRATKTFIVMRRECKDCGHNFQSGKKKAG